MPSKFLTDSDSKNVSRGGPPIPRFASAVKVTFTFAVRFCGLGVMGSESELVRYTEIAMSDLAARSTSSSEAHAADASAALSRSLFHVDQDFDCESFNFDAVNLSVVGWAKENQVVKMIAFLGRHRRIVSRTVVLRSSYMADVRVDGRTPRECNRVLTGPATIWIPERTDVH